MIGAMSVLATVEIAKHEDRLRSTYRKVAALDRCGRLCVLFVRACHALAGHRTKDFLRGEINSANRALM